MRPVSQAVSLALALATTSCTLMDAPEAPGMSAPLRGSAADAGANSASEMDTGVVLAALRAGAFRTASGFTHATRAPYPSSAAEGAWIDEWVSSDAYAQYAMVHPDATGSGALMPVGTVIVRVVLDADGGTTELTVMAKGPPGYNPALGDWWFAVTNPDGTPVDDDAGAMMGRLDGCYTCHTPRAGDDYLFGVPSDDSP